MRRPIAESCRKRGDSMSRRFQGEGIMRRIAVVLLSWFLNLNVAPAQAAGQPTQPDSSCRIEATNYKGWTAQQLSNRWVKLEVVPQNGGGVTQGIFPGVQFLFVNPPEEG